MTNITGPVNNITNIPFTAFAALSADMESAARYGRRSGYVHTDVELEASIKMHLGEGWESWRDEYLREYREARQG